MVFLYEMYWRNLKLHNSFIVAPIEVLFISLCMAFEGLHANIKIFFCDVHNGSYNGSIFASQCERSIVHSYHVESVNLK